MSQSQSAFHTNTNRSSVLTQSENDRMQKKKRKNVWHRGWLTWIFRKYHFIRWLNTFL